MSIAVSALVRPSRIHRLLLGACALIHGATAAALGLQAPLYTLGGPAAALPPALASVFLAVTAALSRKTHRIDISGTGDLCVTVQQDVRAGAPAQAALLPGSVVWPWLMLLRYGQNGGRAHVLVVWRDAVDAASWRALAVALGVLGRKRESLEVANGTSQRGNE